MKKEFLLNVILAPHVSEKSTLASANTGTYVFNVMANATKIDVKKAIELAFKTKVQSVRVMNVKTKPKRFGQMLGRSKAWKKAYVTLMPGEKIDIATNAQ